ncbi:Flp pilus assembly protein CpaB [Nocardioides sp. TRM66260-LWL]|uniref:Flp pilus assembly protein CpaB n=1 Tax=Nocardioides sp. TRM66260-LWL TaxID=2874478 RepID=UPI0027E0D54D|nr:Flp pilus assembly protein CpaB [Nocardioides sp. TRM66260-LWL]
MAAAVVAALGTVLVFLYVKGADQRAQDRFATAQVLVATAQIEQGETVAAAAAGGKLALEPVASDQILPGAATTTEGISDLQVLTTMYPGEQMIPEKLGKDAGVASALPIPAGKVAIAVNLSDPARVAGFINPGSEVAVIYSGKNPATGQPFTRTLLTRATVLAVGSSTPAPIAGKQPTANAPAETVARTLLTLALSQDEAQRILFAQGSGQLTFALLTKQAKLSDTSSVDSTNLFAKR